MKGVFPMMSPKSIARWQELKTKTKNGRTVPEQLEFEKLQMKHNADVITQKELQWKAELAEAIMLSTFNNGNNKSLLNNIINSAIGVNQKPYSRKDIQDFVNTFLADHKPENLKQNHESLSLNGQNNSNQNHNVPFNDPQHQNQH